jgi:hypothetical protein
VTGINDADDAKVPKGYQPTSENEEGDTRIETSQQEYFSDDHETASRDDASEKQKELERLGETQDKDEAFQKVSIKRKADRKLATGKKLKEKRDKTDVR